MVSDQLSVGFLILRVYLSEQGRKIPLLLPPIIQKCKQILRHHSLKYSQFSSRLESNHPRISSFPIVAGFWVHCSSKRQLPRFHLRHSLLLLLLRPTPNRKSRSLLLQCTRLPRKKQFPTTTNLLKWMLCVCSVSCFVGPSILFPLNTFQIHRLRSARCFTTFK